MVERGGEGISCSLLVLAGRVVEWRPKAVILRRSGEGRRGGSKWRECITDECCVDE
jgi:hypothetical protein